MLNFIYLDSCGVEHEFECIENSYNNLMELIFDSGYEDWGDCKGRAWCATCHVKVSKPHSLIVPDIDEKKRLSQLSNRSTCSRLACQIPLTRNLQNLKFEFIGDD